MSLIEIYQNSPAECLEYDPRAPEVARLISDCILTASKSMRAPAGSAGVQTPGDDTGSDAKERVSRQTGRDGNDILVEHFGSTAVPGCAGKGVIDLMLLYPEGRLEHAKRVLDALGFQRQSTRDPFPESRPMRLGAVAYNGKYYRLHVHVISVTSPEVATLRGFRDTLIEDADLKESYVQRKRAIIAAGIVDSVDYSDEKAEFIGNAITRKLLPE